MDHGQGMLEKAEVKDGATTEASPDEERHAYRDDMGDSYGDAYTTRSADEGYGERYGEAVKKIMDNKAAKEEHAQEIQSGTTADRDQSADAEVHPAYDRTQGHPVAEKEDGRHSTNQTAQ